MMSEFLAEEFEVLRAKVKLRRWVFVVRVCFCRLEVHLCLQCSVQCLANNGLSKYLNEWDGSKGLDIEGFKPVEGQHARQAINFID